MTDAANSNLALPDEEATLRLGRELGKALSQALERNPAEFGPGGPCLLLRGGLGAGKTTLVRGLVSALPGAGQARVSSPSFSLVNRYPTAPEVAHVDLYRLPRGSLPGEVPEEVEDALDDPSVLTVIEWPERLHAADTPAQAATIHLLNHGHGRLAECSAAQGAASLLLAQALKRTRGS